MYLSLSLSLSIYIYIYIYIHAYIRQSGGLLRVVHIELADAKLSAL